jgi:hypothetical protein
MNSGKDIDEFDAWWTSQTGGGNGTEPTPTDPIPDDPFVSPGPVDVQPGLDWQYLQEQLALDKYIADLTAQVQREDSANRTAVAEINRASQAESDARNADLQRDLQSGRIDAEKYLQEQRLIQQEAEYTRTLALNTRSQEHIEKMDTINAELARAQEYREERLLHAQLAASPADTVLYEFFKRGLGTPEELEGAGPGGTGAQRVTDTLGGFLEGDGTLSGEDYLAPPPAYSDEALQQLMESIFGATPGAGYNPNLGGIGAFGAEIKSPGDISRSQFLGMGPTTLGILSSFLKAGVQTEPGVDASRVSINPEDYFAQLVRSFIPTAETTKTVYG